MGLSSHGCQATDEHHDVFNLFFSSSDGWWFSEQVDFFCSFGDTCQPFRVPPVCWLSLWSALVFIHSSAQCCLIARGGLAHSWHELPNSTEEVLTSLFLLLPQHWWKFSNLFLSARPTVCSTISNQLWTLKLNYFPLKAHTIPHMSTLLLLGTIAFTIYGNRSVLRQCLTLV